MKYLKYGLLSLCLLVIKSFVSAERVKDLLYMSIDASAACFRRHNGTHQFGCSSSKSGSIGVIHLVEIEEDVVWLEKNATAGPYAIVLSFEMFTMPILKRFKESKNVNGVLLALNSTQERPQSYSPDDTCPNRYSGYETCNKSWNPYGSSLLLEDWTYPMFFVNDDDAITKIKDCYKKFNAFDIDQQHERSLCALEMKSFMFASVDSETCMRRSQQKLNFNPNIFCDPLGDRNVHWAIRPMSDTIKNVIMVIARLDSNSMFDGLEPGAVSTVTGIVTLLATAYHLHSLNATIADKNVVFSLLNGEAMDYIGSSKLVYDLKKGTFDALGGSNVLKLEQISAVVEIGQLGEEQIYLHTVNANNHPLVVDLQRQLNAQLYENSVPPASVQSFLKGNSSLPAIVIANHGKTFVNKYYNSILDDAKAVNFSSQNPSQLPARLARIAISLARTLYNLTSVSTSATGGNALIIEEFIKDLLPCYLESARCPLFQAASPPGYQLPNIVLPLYISVPKSPNLATILTGQLLALLTGIKYPNYNQTECTEKQLRWWTGFDTLTGICVEPTSNYSEAYSPAFIIDGYDMKSGEYSTWTESVWQNFGLRMLLKPSQFVQRLNLMLGSGVAGLSFIIVWFITSHADVIFNQGSVDL